MKKRIFTLVCGALLIGAGLSAQDTLLYYGWEDGTSIGPTGSIWNNTGQTWTHETIINDAANAHSGEGYFKAVVSEDSENVWDNQGVIQEITVEDSTSYRLTLWAKATAGDTTTINITAGEYTTWQDLSTKYGTQLNAEWQKFNLMIFIDSASVLPYHLEGPDGEDKDTIRNQIRFPIHYPRKGTFLVDDVSVIKSTIAGILGSKKQIRIDFGYALEWANNVDKDAFTVKVNDASVTIESAIMVDLGNDVEPWIDLTLTQELSEGDDVTVSHDGNSGLVYFSTGPITDGDYHAAAFDNEIVELVDSIYTPVEEEESSISLTKENQSILNIYPQPANELLNVESSSLINNITVFDVKGSVVLSAGSYNARNVVLNIAELSSGIYMIKVQDNTGNSTIQKFIK